jgi:hypothetical protein
MGGSVSRKPLTCMSVTACVQWVFIGRRCEERRAVVDERQRDHGGQQARHAGYLVGKATAAPTMLTKLVIRAELKLPFLSIGVDDVRTSRRGCADFAGLSPHRWQRQLKWIPVERSFAAPCCPPIWLDDAGGVWLDRSGHLAPIAARRVRVGDECVERPPRALQVPARGCASSHGAAVASGCCPARHFRRSVGCAGLPSCPRSELAQTAVIRYCDRRGDEQRAGPNPLSQALRAVEGSVAGYVFPGQPRDAG